MIAEKPTLCLEMNWPPPAGTKLPIDGGYPFTRADLAEAFAAHGMNYGAEIGVERGLFSEVLCKANPKLRLLCVDAWQAYAGYRDHVGQSKLDGFFESACRRLAPYGCEMIRKFSIDAAAEVPDGSLDFVYIDGAHDYASVTADIAAWAPKVRSAGVVSGHDYGRSSVGQVKDAVIDWTTAHEITPWFVIGGDRSPSWFWVKR